MTTDYERLAREIERLGDERHAIGIELDDIKDELDHTRADLQELRETARALLDSLPYHTPECPYCPGRVMATKVATLKPPLAGIRFTCDAHVQDGDEACDLETSAQVRTLRALLEGT